MRYGSEIDPHNRFQRVQVHLDDDPDPEPLARKVEYLYDDSKSIVAKNNSPDLPFGHSINPYRGCAHGCSYCYARPTHEYLGLNAGLDFETKIIVKKNAPHLFRRFLSNKTWQPQPIAISGVTDCYQPAERHFKLTRGCLEIALEARQPIGIVTKNALIERDIEILTQMASMDLVHVFLSITTLDAKLAREMEPRTSTPAARLRAMETLANAKIPVGVMVAPIIPGLNDDQIPTILKSASDAGARTVGHVLLRLPLTVAPVFHEWLQRTQPLKADRVMSRIRKTRDGQINQSTFGTRMRGSGEIAEQIHSMIGVFKRKYGMDQPMPPYNCNQFRRPENGDSQPWLF